VGDVAILLVGLAGLWAGTEFVIRGALSIAHRFGLSELFVGLVILSIGSNLPEIFVGIDSGIRNLQGIESSGIVIGASIGSALGQIGFVMAILGLVSYLTLGRRYIYRHGSVMLGSIIVLALVGWDTQVTRIEGLMMLLLYAMYLLMLTREERSHGFERPDTRSQSVGIRPWLILLAGFALLVISSEFTVSSVYRLSLDWGVPQTLISILLIGLGTSLPELAIAIGAILRKRTGLSVGNLIGSNILDTLLPIGLSAVISPLLFERNLLWFDLPVLFLLSAVVLALFLRKRGLQRPEAMLIMAIYFAYVIAKLGFS
jgi:cation:H+ antiporter